MNTTPHPDYQPRTLLPCRAVLFDCDGVLVNSAEFTGLDIKAAMQGIAAFRE